jgi:hypothetical protein
LHSFHEQEKKKIRPHRHTGAVTDRKTHIHAEAALSRSEQAPTRGEKSAGTDAADDTMDGNLALLVICMSMAAGGYMGSRWYAMRGRRRRWR